MRSKFTVPLMRKIAQSTYVEPNVQHLHYPSQLLSQHQNLLGSTGDYRMVVWVVAREKHSAKVKQKLKIKMPPQVQQKIIIMMILKSNTGSESWNQLNHLRYISNFKRILKTFTHPLERVIQCQTETVDEHV